MTLDQTEKLFDNQMDRLEKIILENRIDILENNLSSTISLFGTIGTIVALILVALVFWLNQTVNNKLEQIKKINEDIDESEKRISALDEQVENKKIQVVQVYDELKHIKGISENVIRMEELEQINSAMFKFFILTEQNYFMANKYISESSKLITVINENKDKLDKYFNDDREGTPEVQYQHFLNQFELEKQKFKERDYSNFIFDDFILSYNEQIRDKDWEAIFEYVSTEYDTNELEGVYNKLKTIIEE